MTRLRATDPRADAIRMIGLAEVDWYSTSHVSKLGDHKQRQIEWFGFDRDLPGVWFPHFHVLADLRGSCEVEFSRALERKWNVSGLWMVKIKSLRGHQTKDEAIQGCLEYASKRKHYYTIDRGGWSDERKIPWSEPAIVEYYNMLDSVGGFSLLRFHLKPKKNTVDDCGESSCEEPQPTSFCVSENPYPLINNWGLN